jgi:hypothetical protein
VAEVVRARIAMQRVSNPNYQVTPAFRAIRFVFFCGNHGLKITDCEGCDNTRIVTL